MATDSIRLWSCKWARCRDTFTLKDDLVRHVLVAHVATAKKVKKKDVPLILRAEQGLGVAASFIPSIPTTAPLGSNPSDLSQPSQSPVRSSGRFSAYNAQSSPVHTPPFLSLPSSPAMDDMVSNAVSQTMRDNSPSRNQPHPDTITPLPPRSCTSRASSTTSARDVEDQLTQSVEPETPSTAPDPVQSTALSGPPHFRSGILHIPYPSSSSVMDNSIGLENGPVNGQVIETATVSQPSTTDLSSHSESAKSWQERDSSLSESTVASHPQGRHLGVTQQAAESQTLQLQTQAPYSSQSSTDDSQ